MDVGGFNIGGALLFTVLAIIVIWIFIEVKRLKHKLFAVLLIVMILFFYISVTVTLKGQDIDLKSIPGIKEAGGIYLSWIGSIFTNLKTLTTNAIKMDWSSETDTKTKINKTGS